ncbi:MAG: hypothetical protein IJI98_05480 [Methanosphaera sp.]|uniref:hypothetical protein n=1 Tax=Methanosphaera sp. ISO3-F5 TaxID=1452353 RepID=UPI002B25FD1E|nr:hypothetical protein [Methanosphaera sp. ISO3-F5]MBR0472130.1 hypothetical protein [Methanosphaera sp.]WQH63696.1 hypothetical protein PXD04_08310 [Methanosphaera sp. ISO3-F5]
MKSIQISDEVHQLLTKISNGTQNFDDVIYKLLIDSKYVSNEEFSDEEASYYNECIRKIEEGDYSGTSKLDLDTLDDELDRMDDD